MKILILSRGIPNSHDPQEGIFEWDQAKALKAEGHEVVVMCVDSRIRKYWRKPGISKMTLDGITAYKLFLFPTSVIRHLISFKAGVNIEAYEAVKLYEYVVKKEGAFDIIHAHFLTPIYYAAAIKRKHDVSLIGTEHWSKVNTTNPGKNIKYMAAKAYPQVDGLIAVSASLKKRLKENFGIDSLVVHNLIDTSNILPLKVRQSDRFRIVLVGSLIPRKGFDYFIRSFARSKLASEEVEVRILGGGPEYGKLQELIIQKNLNKKVFLLGQQPRKKIFEELNIANVFVLPSYIENFSVSVLEALANGVPVIATICGGIRECIGATNGILVEVGNENEMSAALDRIYREYNTYDFNRIQQECLSLYSPQSISQQLTNCYQQVAKNASIK